MPYIEEAADSSVPRAFPTRNLRKYINGTEHISLSGVSKMHWHCKTDTMGKYNYSFCKSQSIIAMRKVCTERIVNNCVKLYIMIYLEHKNIEMQEV